MGWLKKPFKEKDLQRLRNLIQGKYQEKTVLGVGYEKDIVKYKEGDIWEKEGRKWTIKNGIKQNITVLDNARTELTLPLFCPNCSKIMNNQHDKQFYIQYKRCFDCQIEFETQIKIKGLWNEYEKHIINTDIDYIIKDFNIWFDEIQQQESFITENGNVETWIGDVKKKLLEDKEKTIDFLQKLKK